MSETQIDRFEGNYFFLSNFYPWPFQYNSNFYPTSEHAFQCEKTTSRQDFSAILAASTPAQAKKLGSRVRLIEGWNQKRDGVMYDILKAKFGHEYMCNRLLSTGSAVLIEGNSWKDTYWGCTWNAKISRWEGQNKLGLILMRIRSELSST